MSADNTGELANIRVLVEIDGPVATLTLNRPDKRNAINMAMWASIEAHVSALTANRDIQVLISLNSQMAPAENMPALTGQPKKHWRISLDQPLRLFEATAWVAEYLLQQRAIFASALMTHCLELHQPSWALCTQQTH